MSIFLIGLAALATVCYGLMWVTGQKDIPAWVPTLLALNWLITELQRYELLTK